MTRLTPSRDRPVSRRIAAPRWDAAIIGAGPAGALLARELARQGARVVLIDRASFPRAKVCGGCLNGAALAALEQVGLGELSGQLGARRLERARLLTRWAEAELDLPLGMSLSRTALDAALVESAQAEGVHFLSRTTATVGDATPAARWLMLDKQGHADRLQARVVFVADGVGGRSLAGLTEFRDRVAPAARIGLSTTLTTADDGYESGTVTMLCGRGAYLGLVRFEQGELHLAAACDARHLCRCGSPATMAAQLLREVGLPQPAELAGAAWHGTPPLTHTRPRQAAERLFVLGDAASYVEPFTGEGIAWALGGALELLPIALEALAGWDARLAVDWETACRARRSAQQRPCRWIARGLRSPLLASAACAALGRAPWLADRLLQKLNTAKHLPARAGLTKVVA